MITGDNGGVSGRPASSELLPAFAKAWHTRSQTFLANFSARAANLRARAAFKLTVAGTVDLGRRENGFGTEGTGDVIGVGGNCALTAMPESWLPEP